MIWVLRFERSLCLAGLKLGLVLGVSGCQDGGPALFDEATGRLGI